MQKKFYTHLYDNTSKEFSGGKDYVDLHPDFVAMRADWE
jgi:hypothetical protein